MEKKSDEDENLASLLEIENLFFFIHFENIEQNFFSKWSFLLINSRTTVYDTSNSWNSESMKFRDELSFNSQITVIALPLLVKEKRSSKEAISRSHWGKKKKKDLTEVGCVLNIFIHLCLQSEEGLKGENKGVGENSTACLPEFTALLQGIRYNLKLENNLS